jgi:hypothetical protein
MTAFGHGKTAAAQMLVDFLTGVVPHVDAVRELRAVLMASREPIPPLGRADGGHCR